MTAGCVSDGTTVGSLGANATPGTPSPAAPAPVAMGAFLEGPVGLRLDDADKDAAFKAETQALSTGERRTWRGSKGVYGYVEPGASGSAPAPADANGAGECRTFTHTVYFGGRPQVGHGSGCRAPDGTWRIVS